MYCPQIIDYGAHWSALERIGAYLERIGAHLERIGAHWSILEHIGAYLERIGLYQNNNNHIFRNNLDA